MCDEARQSRIQELRRQVAELGSAVRKLDRSGLDNAAAQLLLLRKQAELDDLMKRGQSNATRSAPMVRPQRG